MSDDLITVPVPECWFTDDIHDNILSTEAATIYTDVGTLQIGRCLHEWLARVFDGHVCLEAKWCDSPKSAAFQLRRLAKKHLNIKLVPSRGVVNIEEKPEDVIPGPKWVEEPRGTSGFEWL